MYVTRTLDNYSLMTRYSVYVQFPTKLGASGPQLWAACGQMSVAGTCAAEAQSYTFGSQCASQFGGQIGNEGSWRQRPVRRPTCNSAVGVGRREWQGEEVKVKTCP